MGFGSTWHWILLLIVAVLLFGGGGKISSLMADVAKGIKSFKKGMADDDVADAKKPADAKVIEQTAKSSEASADRSKAV